MNGPAIARDSDQTRLTRLPPLRPATRQPVRSRERLVSMCARSANRMRRLSAELSARIGVRGLAGSSATSGLFRDSREGIAGVRHQ